ncbi:MAG: dCTP deaminase [Paraclostridium sp.]
MAILGGLEIQKRLGDDIIIRDFKESNINPNSYNLTLNEELIIYDEAIIDMKKNNKTKKTIIPEDGFVLYPGKVYLARVNEWTETFNLVPIVEGRSSIGRLGLSVHPSTGFGDNGFKGYFTLELTVAQPLRIYANTAICQIVYHTLEGESTPYNGRYQNSEEVIACRLYKDFE